MRRIEVASYNERGSFIQKEGWKTVVRWSARHRCIAKFFSSEEAGGEVGFCDPTLSHPRGRCSKRAKPTERRIVLWRSYSIFISLFFGYTSRRALASSQPIMRSHDNADKYLKKKRGEKKRKRRFGPLEINNATSAAPPPSPVPIYLAFFFAGTNKATTTARNSVVFASAVRENKRNSHGWFRVLV